MSETFPLIVSIYWAAEEIDPMELAACPVCHSAKGHICWGHYWRYRPGTDQCEAIQRLLCKNDECPRKTFSILPHPFLRIVRFTLCSLLAILAMFEAGETVSELARQSGVARSTIRRTVAFACRLKAWMDRESQTAPWAPSPCLCPKRLWPSFVRAFSWAFYPARS
jgi:hypothetical protein